MADTFSAKEILKSIVLSLTWFTPSIVTGLWAKRPKRKKK